RLSWHTGLPLVLDYRDEWDLVHSYLENKQSDFISRFIQSRMQQQVVRSAKAVVATTRCSARSLDVVRAKAGSTARVAWIYNGFDPDDFSSECEVSNHASERFRLVYVGTLWSLTTIAPLIEAVRLLAWRQPEAAARLEVVVVGRSIGIQDTLL